MDAYNLIYIRKENYDIYLGIIFLIGWYLQLIDLYIYIVKWNIILTML